MPTEEQRVLKAINESRYTWRPAEAISKQTGLPVERVREILETTSSAEILRAPHRNAKGYVLYTTRAHLVNTSGVMARYLGTQKSS